MEKSKIEHNPEFVPNWIIRVKGIWCIIFLIA